MKKNIIYIDVTDFLHWSGHFTGIQRVVYNLARQISSKQRVSLIVYTEGNYCLLEQSLDSLIKEGLKVKHVHVPTREEKFKAKVDKIYLGLPTKIQSFIEPVMPIFKRAYHHIVPLTRKTLHIIRLQQKKLKIINKEEYLWVPDHDDYGDIVNFNSGDKLVVLGCLWEGLGHLKAVIDSTMNDTILSVLIYDLIPIYHSHTFGEGLLPVYAEYLFEVLSVASYVFAISNSTANDIKRFMLETGIQNEPKIQVIRLGDNLPVKITKNEDRVLKTTYSKPFIICVGTIEARKNHILLYKALKLAAQQGTLDNIPHLYVIGRRGWLAQDVEYFLRNDETVRRRVTILNDISDKELAWFYSNAQFSIYPSQYEGWGLPVAESLVYGTPCITSNSSSMVEIAPSLVELISPYDPVALLQAMLKYSSADFIANRRMLIKQHYRPITWEQTCQQIIETLII